MNWLSIILSVLVIVFALWESSFSKWILVLLGVVLAVMAFMHKHPSGPPAAAPVAAAAAKPGMKK